MTTASAFSLSAALGGDTFEIRDDRYLTLYWIEMERRGWLQKIDFVFEGQIVPENLCTAPIYMCWPKETYGSKLHFSIIAYPHPKPFEYCMQRMWYVGDTDREFEYWLRDWERSLRFGLRAERFRLLRPRRSVLPRNVDLMPTGLFLMIVMQDKADQLRRAITASRQPNLRYISRFTLKRLCRQALYDLHRQTPELDSRITKRHRREIAKEAKKWLKAWSRSEESTAVYNAMHNAILAWHNTDGNMCGFM